MPFSISWSHFPFLNICSGIMSLRLCQLTAKWHTEDVEKKKKNNTRLQEAFVFQLLSYAWLFVTPWTVAHQAFLSSVSQGFLKLVSIELVIPSNHLILCRPLLLATIFPSIRVFSNESALHISWPKYWSFSISPSMNIQGLFPLVLTGLISLQSKGLSSLL